MILESFHKNLVFCPTAEVKFTRMFSLEQKKNKGQREIGILLNIKKVS